MSMPPTKPTLPVLLAIAAAIPTRNDPSCSLKTIDWTLGRSTTASTMANFVPGNSLATFSTPLAWEKPIATTICEPRRAMLRSACSQIVVAIGFSRFLLEPLGAVVGGLVEGLVELAAHVEDDGRRELLGADTAGERRGGDEQDGGDAPRKCGHGLRPLGGDDTPCWRRWRDSATLGSPWRRRGSTWRARWDSPRRAATSTLPFLSLSCAVSGT